MYNLIESFLMFIHRSDNIEPKIAVIRFSAFGDIAASLPILRALKYKPTIITSQLGYEFLKDEFDDFIILKDKNFYSILKLIFKIKQKKFDIILDFQNNDRSRLITTFLDTKIYNNKNIVFQNSYQNFYDITKAAGLLNTVDTNFIQKPKSYIVLNCGSSPKWKSKRLPFEKWKDISKILYDKYKLPFYLTGDKSELEYLKELSNHIYGEKTILAGKTSLIELKKVFKEAFLTVSTDSAAMHISAAQKTPTIGIFGPTNWERSKPYGPWSTIVYDKMFYPDGIPPQKSKVEIKNYFDNIDIQTALKKISTYLS